MIQMVAPIISARIVPDPLAVGVHVRSFRMPLNIAETALVTAPLFWSALLHWSLPLLRSALLRSSLSSGGRRTVGWNISATDTTLATLIPTVASAPLVLTSLRKPRNRKA
jgi:hypothetical protein